MAIIRGVLAEHADHVRAGPMRAYMKSALPYRGVPLPAVRKVSSRAYADHPLPDRAAWEATIRSTIVTVRRR